MNSPPVVVRGSSGTFTSPGSPKAPDPAALDAEWTAYSNQSGCADWAGGDGVSAIRLNSSQLAWFFSDTFIGPAGPTTGFSHISGFAHNAVVVQTRTRPGSAFVTVTGGGACTGPGRPGNAAPVVGDSPWLSGTHDRYWDEDGLRTGGTIVKFYNRYAASTFPFVPLGTVIASFDASQLSSAGHGSRYGATNRPTLVRLPSYTPPAGGSPILWIGDDAHDFRIMYEARAEPDLSSGNTLVISYNVNSVGVNTGCQPMASYTNTVLRLGRHGAAGRVRSRRPDPFGTDPFGAERAVRRSGDRAAEPGAMVRLVGPAARLPAHTRRNLGARQRGLGPGKAELARCRPGPPLPRLPDGPGPTGRQPGDHRVP